MKSIKVGTLVKKKNRYNVAYVDGIIGIVVACAPEDEPSLETYKVNYGEYGTFWSLRENLEVISESR